MSIAQWERLLAGLLVLAAVVCGVIGLVAGFDDRELELGVTGCSPRLPLLVSWRV